MYEGVELHLNILRNRPPRTDENRVHIISGLRHILRKQYE